MAAALIAGGVKFSMRSQKIPFDLRDRLHRRRAGSGRSRAGAALPCWNKIVISPQKGRATSATGCGAREEKAVVSERRSPF
jgi:hypothetical protein